MNANFKPLGLAAAVATVAAGYAGAVNAAEVAAQTERGDLAIVPYYTVLGGYATGINITNTSNQTQAVKIRFRRASDSMDAMDFNVILSPYDVYAGYIALEGDGETITFTSGDNSCTAPAATDGKFTMPPIYRLGAETGYVEVIAMGSADDAQPVSVAAKHGATGVPASCTRVRDNFFANDEANPALRGVINPALTHQTNAAGTGLEASTWGTPGNALKVQYFIKSDVTGVEFGDNAVHVEDFITAATITNQQKGVFEGDLQGFDHPDLNGGSPLSAAATGQFQELRDIMGAYTLINSWSENRNDTVGFTVDTDWVVTYPGQYTMLNLPQYLGSLALPEDIACVGGTVPACDNRDIPMVAEFGVFDREERGILVEEGDLVVSPQPPGTVIQDVLDKEVNVIQWGVNSVLNAPAFIEVQKPAGANAGWASLRAFSSASKTQSICEYDVPAVSAGIAILPKLPKMTCTEVLGTGSAPVVGFTAWQRAFDANPGSNYGRIIAHSRKLTSLD